MNQLEIVFEQDLQTKQSRVKEVLADLSEWFGLPEATKSYIEKVHDLPCWIAKSDNKCLGFIYLSPTTEETAEVYCMGVKKEYHHRGIGRKLFQALEQFAKKKYRFLQVKTVAEGYYPFYDETVQFYLANGFSRLEVFPTMWDEWNPCLILIKALDTE